MLLTLKESCHAYGPRIRFLFELLAWVPTYANLTPSLSGSPSVSHSSSFIVFSLFGLTVCFCLVLSQTSNEVGLQYHFLQCSTQSQCPRLRNDLSSNTSRVTCSGTAHTGFTVIHPPLKSPKDVCASPNSTSQHLMVNNADLQFYGFETSAGLRDSSR